MFSELSDVHSFASSRSNHFPASNKENASPFRSNPDLSAPIRASRRRTSRVAFHNAKKPSFSQSSTPAQRTSLTRTYRPLDNVRAATSNFRTARLHTRSYSQGSNSNEENNSTPLRLPRYLSRPTYRPIDPLAVAAVNPVLADIPLSYVQHTLKDVGPKLFQATCNPLAKPPTGQLPETLALICLDVNIEPPSHIFAVYAGGCEHERMVLFPVHALVLVTSCANLPILPPSSPIPPAAPDEAITLPVVPLRIPSPATFPILLSYIYTRCSNNLFDELLPVDEGSKQTMDELARKRAASASFNVLMDDARKVYGLWRNSCALGFFDEELFSVLEFIWEACLNALAIKTGKSLNFGGSKCKERRTP